MNEKSFNDQWEKKLFLEARTQSSWQKKTITEQTIKNLFDLSKMPPTSANCSPGRFIFIVTKEAKEKLRPAISKGNLEQTLNAPITVIIAYDTKFYDHLDYLYPNTNAKDWFVGNDELINETAFRNGTLQGAYLIMAARGLGLDCGPMSGFDKLAINKTFFPEGRFKVNFLLNIGYGDNKKVNKRSPRFKFEEVCEIL